MSETTKRERKAAAEKRAAEAAEGREPEPVTTTAEDGSEIVRR